MLMKSTVDRLLAEDSEAGSVQATNGEPSVSRSDGHVTEVPTQERN
jgi:hypothetical protein